MGPLPLSLFRQSKNINCIVAARRPEFGDLPEGSQSARRAMSGQHRNVLFPVDRVSDGAHLNDPAENRFPKRLAGVGI